MWYVYKRVKTIFSYLRHHENKEICYKRNISRNQFYTRLSWIRALNNKLENEKIPDEINGIIVNNQTNKCSIYWARRLEVI